MSLAVVSMAIVTAVGKVKTWIVTAFDKAKEWVVATIVVAVVASVGKAKGWVVAAVGKAKEWIVATIGKAKESARHYKGGLYVFLTCIVSVVDGLLFGYNIRNLEQKSWPIQDGGSLLASQEYWHFCDNGAILLLKTPKGLIEQGKREKGRRILAKIRGIDDVNIKFEDMIHASDLANSIEHSFRKMLDRRNIPILVMAIFMLAFKILMGMSFILFYTAVFFQSIGFGENASLYCLVDIVAVMVVSTFISIAIVDRLGQRVLLISGGIQMILCQIIIAIILGLKFGDNQSLSKDYSALVVVVLCLLVLAFECSWEPLYNSSKLPFHALHTQVRDNSFVEKPLALEENSPCI
ncbi:hypothetical protein SLEP1_g49493 [Rubroshorea leprosula]|uniref:Uncharacterized protein n=1 Tax=Rubroshorea leprosula TaxID=152421 RepID=A0AAV5M016_9ROSI|nr:hypothetical protein SLEP1_g49493 [Rubroshorea leprosula]